MRDLEGTMLSNLMCPDCNCALASLSCPLCKRSFQPEPDGIIDAMPRELEYAARMTELQGEIERSGGVAREQKVVRFEQAFHDEQAAYYDDLLSDPEPIRTYVRRLITRDIYGLIRNCDFVVDLCCGTGKGSLALLEKGLSVAGLDVSREMLRVYAKKAGKRNNLILIQADATRPPFRPGSCPAIMMLGGLHHIPDRKACIQNCCAALAGNGLLIVHEPLKTGRTHWLVPIIKNLDAATNPMRVMRAIKHRLGLGNSSSAAPSSERLDFTPYERSFTSATELTQMLPPAMQTLELRSKLVLSDYQFGPQLQPIKPLAKTVVALDEWLSRSGRAKWSGNALYGVFRKTTA